MGSIRIERISAGRQLFFLLHGSAGLEAIEAAVVGLDAGA
jgi:hypothetical protein